MNRYLCTTLSLAIFCAISASASESLTQQTTVVRDRNEPLQWTPESVTVFTGERLAETRLDDIADLEAISPGLLVDGLAGAPQGAAIWMRGIGSSETDPGAFPAVSIALDGVYMGTPASQNLVLFDVDRIEVARGPEGIFEGVPAPAGSINLYRSKPTGKLSAKTRLTLGSFERRRFDAVANFPIIDKLAGKVTFNSWRGGNSIARNTNTGRQENEDQLTAGSLSLLWQDERFNVQYTYDGQVDKSDVPALLNLSSSTDLLCSATGHCSVDGNGLVPEGGDYAHILQGFGNARDYTVRQSAIHASTELGGNTISSITALRNTNETSYQDLDATAANFYSILNREHYRQASETLNFSRELSPAFSYVAGLYLLNSSFRRAHTDYYIMKALSDQGLVGPVPTGTDRMAEVSELHQLRSVFAHLSWQLDPQWTADLGIRGTLINTRFSSQVTYPAPGGDALPPVAIDRDTDNSNFSGTAGLTYKVDNNAMIYMRYGHDFRPGGFDAQVNSIDASSPYREAQSDSYEVGLKSEWFDHHLRLNYVGYRQDYKKKLERYPAVTGSGSVESLLRNTSDIRTFGHELEVEAIPWENLRLRASLSHTNSDYLTYFIPDLSGTSTAGYLDLNTTIPPYSPPDQFAFSATYDFPYAGGHVALYAGYRFTTSYWSLPDVPAGHANTFALLDFSAQFDWQDWNFLFFSKNINNRRYFTNARQISAAQVTPLPAGTTADPVLMTTAQFNQPRFSGFEIVYNFRAHTR